tara:strand:+ start:251 stop:1099 length:849 start_codon:yes stop_codon:yes gene_type:complete
MRILKRKKGKKEFYYLQHSYRKKGKVITKEHYLGKTIPKDVEEMKKAWFRELQGEVYKKFEDIKKHFQKEWKRIPSSVKKKQLEEISIAFTYNTNAIEGSTITLEETRRIIHDKRSPEKSLYDIKETDEHSKLFLVMLEKKERISNELLLRWHKDIFGETKPEISGKYRDFLVRVGSYLAPDWQDVEKLMRKFIKDVNVLKLHPVELAARAHYQFESIHPFGDGNGRIGRLLMNYILWHAGYPMLIIEFSSRGSYYKAFKRGEEGFVQYFFRRYLKVHGKRV